MAAAGTDLGSAPGGDELAGVDAALADRVAGGGAELATQAIQLRLTERAGQAGRGDAGLPEGLVGKEVADPCESVLIEQASLDGGVAGADSEAKLVAGDQSCVGTDVAEIRVEDRAAEAALVLEGEPCAVLELDREAIPAFLLGVFVEGDPAGHAEVQPERRAVIGLQPEELSTPVCGDEALAGQRRIELAGLMRPAHVGVVVIDVTHRATDGVLQDEAGTFRFGQLGHVSMVGAADSSKERGRMSQIWHEHAFLRHIVRPHPADMAPIDQKQLVEHRFMALMEDSGLPLPDEVEYGTDCVRFLWLDRKLVVIVDIESSGEVDANGGFTREGIAA